MIKFLLILFILFLPTSASAGELYAVEKPDGSVSVINYYGGEPLINIINDLGFAGYPIRRITKADLPDRADREVWAFNDVPIGKKLKVDTVKKAQKKAEKAAKEAEREAVLLKLKISKDEFKKLKELK